MQRERVDSEALRSVGYDPKRRLLEVEFTSGEIYCYLQVPPDLHLDLMQSRSKGAFFAEHLRDAGFEFSQPD